MSHLARHYIHREINRKTQKRTNQIRAHNSGCCIFLITPCPVFLREGYGDIAPYCQRYCKPNGYCVEGLAEYGVEVDEDGPCVGILINLRSDFDVHMYGIWYVF